MIRVDIVAHTKQPFKVGVMVHSQQSIWRRAIGHVEGVAACAFGVSGREEDAPVVGAVAEIASAFIEGEFAAVVD